jgi:hypothetical protein
MPTAICDQNDLSILPAVDLSRVPPVFVTASLVEPLPLVVALQALKHCAVGVDAESDIDALSDLIVLMKRGEPEAAHLRLSNFFGL